MRTTQAAVSLKLKRLEERLGWRLVERTARYVQLSARGAAFLERARELLEVHDRALAAFAVTPEPGSASPSASATMLRGRSSPR
jgi:DNA-binding transcriptional LysR family regulator